jgi:hypothetical protein
LGGCTDGGTFGWLSGTVGLVGLGGGFLGLSSGGSMTGLGWGSSCCGPGLTGDGSNLLGGGWSLVDGGWVLGTAVGSSGVASVGGAVNSGVLVGAVVTGGTLGGTERCTGVGVVGAGSVVVVEGPCRCWSRRICRVHRLRANGGTDSLNFFEELFQILLRRSAS